MAKFRKKADDKIYEVEQFTQELLEAHLFEGQPLPQGVTLHGAQFHKGERLLYSWRCTLTTIHGQEADLAFGDWIMPEPDGEHFYPIKPDIFEERYEQVTAAFAEKTLHNSDIAGAKQNVPDIKVVGNGDLWQLLCKASSESEGWMKSSKAMQVTGGCLVQVTTQQRNIDGTYSIAEAVCYVPGVAIADDTNGGRKLVTIAEASAATSA